MGGKPIEETRTPNSTSRTPPPAAIPKMGKCYEITHFLDFLRISYLFSQPNNLITFVIKKRCLIGPISPPSPFRGA